MSAGRSNFERTLHALLTFHVHKVRVVVPVLLENLGRVFPDWCYLALAGDKLRHLAQRPGRINFKALHNRRLGNIVGRHNHTAFPLLPGANCNRQHAGNAAHRAAKCKFADNHEIIELLRDNLLAHSQNTDGHWQIEARSFFFHVRRREIDRCAAHHIFETAVFDGGFDTVARFLHRRIR